MSKGRNFQDRTLSITWVSSHHLHRGKGGNMATSMSSSTGTNLVPGSTTSQRAEQLTPMTDEEIDLEVVDIYLTF